MKIFNKQLSKEEMRKEQMFSITRYLEACYLNGQEPASNVVEHVDFSEVSSKHIIHYSEKHGQFNDHIEETLAENCIAHLPFSAYEKFITEDWINFAGRDERSITRTALSRKNIDLLERLHDLGIKRALDDKEFIHTYTREYIQKIYLIGNHFNTSYDRTQPSEDFNERFLKLVRKCVCEHDYFGDITWKKNKNLKLVYKKNPNWIKDCAWFSQSSSEGIEKSYNNILKSLVSSEKYMLLLEDGLIQIAKNHPKEIKYILGLEFNPKEPKKDGAKLLDNVLGVAFERSNFPAAKLLVETFGLSAMACFSAYRENVIYDVNRVKENYTDTAPLNSLLNNNFTSFYKNAQKEFFPTLETDYLPLFILGKDQVLKQELLANKKEVFMKKIPFGKDSFTLYDSILLAKAVETINLHLTKEGQSLEFSCSREPCSNMTLKDMVAKHIYNNEKSLLAYVDYNNISDKEWNKLFENDTLSEFLKVHQGNKSSKIEFKDLKTLWNASVLNMILSNDNVQTTKKIKL